MLEIRGKICYTIAKEGKSDKERDMVYVLLGIAALAVTCQDIFKQKYNSRCNGGVFFFSGMISLFAMLFFMAVNRDWSYRAELLLPSVGFALSYATATVCAVLAIRCGSLAKTTLIVSCSLLIPSFYGMVALKEPISVTLVIGTVLLLVALFLINYRKQAKGERKTKGASWKWAIFVVLAFVGNGMCSTVQKAEQLYFGEEGKNMFMIVALGFVVVILLTLSFCLREERTAMKETLRRGWLWALLCGLMNGLTNYLVIYLNPRLPASVLFPVISGGSLTLVFLYSTLIRKEKFSPRQYVGFLVGVVSIVLLNL